MKILSYLQKKKQPGILLNVDFEKAFKSINWKFIERSLQAFNFCNNFIRYICTIYNNITSAVINNGEISEWFYPKQGVRQQCPISAYLFIMAVELLAISIRKNDNIRGIIGEGTEIKISQLADDTSCFVRDLSSLAEILSIFKDFQQYAGLSVNVDKTKAVSLKGVQEFPFDLDWSKTKVSLLGVILSGNKKEHYDLNF